MNTRPFMTSVANCVTTVAVLLFAPALIAQIDEGPASVERANSGPDGLWKLRSGHLVWGMPRQTDNRHNIKFPGEPQPRPGMSVLVREGFVVGHYDLFKVPAWVSVRWTREDYERLIEGSYSRSFGADPELPRYARAGTDYDYSDSDMERGHMARHDDNEAWGKDNSNAGCLMSNIVPQHKDMNGEAWNDLEEMHQEIVADSSIDTVWVISGPIYQDDRPESTVGNGVAVPKATYKVVGWFANDGTFHARGFVVRQEDRERHNPAHYLTPIRDIENATGLDFFPELPAARANAVETAAYDNLWGDDGEPGGAGAGAMILIASLLPNPSGDESMNETVTVRNDGNTNVALHGWLLRDEADRTWQLFGVIDPGDEMTFTRNRQPMALNNGGDTVTLVRPDQSVADTVTYGSASEDQLITADQFE